MFFAINSITNEKVNSLNIENNGSYQKPSEEIWFADPNEIDSCPSEMDKTKIIMRYREGSTDHISSLGKKFDVAPHFFIPNKTKLGINTIPESKEHKLAKNWIYNKLNDKTFNINYSSVSKPYKYNNSINLFDLPIDYPLIGLETTSSTFGKKIYRRADVICPFIVKHPLLGNGVVFEIQFSKQTNKVRSDRELDWAIRGYSVAWLFIEDFEKLTEQLIILKKEEINVSSFAALIKLNNKSFIRNLKFEVQEQCRLLDNKKHDLISDIDNFFRLKMENVYDINIESMIESYLDNKSEEYQPTCPACNIKMLLRNKKDGSGQFWGCTNFRISGCKEVSAARYQK